MAIGVVGGSTVVLDLAGLRLVTDPSLSSPGEYGPLTKTEGPAVDPDDLGPADAILLSHDQHTDNFDQAGRDYALAASRIVTTTGAAQRLGAGAVGLAPWQRTTLPRRDRSGELTIESVPAIHGPLDSDRDDDGHVNGEVTGFVISGEQLPTIYVSGDNAAISAVAQIATRHPRIDIAVLFAGAARNPLRSNGRPLTLTSQRAADAAVLLGAQHVIPAHYQGWSLYSEPAERITAAFDDAGIAGALRLGELGCWALEMNA